MLKEEEKRETGMLKHEVYEKFKFRNETLNPSLPFLIIWNWIRTRNCKEIITGESGLLKVKTRKKECWYVFVLLASLISILQCVYMLWTKVFNLPHKKSYFKCFWCL